jgi:hypothetical protein
MITKKTTRLCFFPTDTIICSILFFFSIFFLSCSKKDPEKFLGKWKVEEVGMQGMEITYEFTKDKIIIESKLEKNIADSLGQKQNVRVEESYTLIPDDSDVFTLKAVNQNTKDTGQYIIMIDGERMTLTDFQRERYNLTHIKH